MKLAIIFAAGLLVGAVVGYLAGQLGRYELHIRDGYMVRFDRITGHAWYDTSTNHWIQP